MSEGALALEHEMVGWPGSVELDRTIDLLAGQAPNMREALAGKVFGRTHMPFSEMQRTQD